MGTRDKIINAANSDILYAELIDAMQARTLLAASSPSATFTAQLDGAPITAGNVVGGDGLKAGPGSLRRNGFTDTTGIAGGKILVLDDSADWRDRLLVIHYQVKDTVNEIPGGSSDDRFEIENTVSRANVNGKLLYTGNGITADVGSANPVEGGGAGVPETSTGAGNFSKNLITASTDLQLYVERNTPYRLCVYNTTAATTYWLAFQLQGSTKQGKRP
jgi:hypothetical protein